VPKRPLSAYFAYSKDHRKRLRNVLLAERRKEDPDALPPSNAEVSKRVSVQWAGMTEEEKKPYSETAERERERYQAAKVGGGGGKRKRGEEEEEEVEMGEEEGGEWERRMLVVPPDQMAFLEGLEWGGEKEG